MKLNEKYSHKVKDLDLEATALKVKKENIMAFKESMSPLFLKWQEALMKPISEINQLESSMIQIAMRLTFSRVFDWSP